MRTALVTSSAGRFVTSDSHLALLLRCVPPSPRLGRRLCPGPGRADGSTRRLAGAGSEGASVKSQVQGCVNTKHHNMAITQLP